IYALIAGSRVTVAQVLLATYFAAGMLFLVKLFDFAVRWALRTIFFIPRDKHQLSADLIARASIAAIARLAIGVMIVLPYVMCCVMTYRPKLASAGDPRTQAGLDFEPVAFPATDNLRLAGWWIPSAGDRASTQTILLCHGFAADKSKQPVLLRELVQNGFNVLAIDLRAH